MSYGRDTAANARLTKGRMRNLRRKRNVALGALGGVEKRNAELKRTLGDCRAVLTQMIALQAQVSTEVLQGFAKKITPAALARVQKKIDASIQATAKMSAQVHKLHAVIGNEETRRAEIARDAQEAQKIVKLVHTETLREVDEISSVVTGAYNQIQRLGPLRPEQVSVDPQQLVRTTMLRISDPNRRFDKDTRTLFVRKRGSAGLRHAQPGFEAAHKRAQEGVAPVKPLDE